jgi:hypothetical protein
LRGAGRACDAGGSFADPFFPAAVVAWPPPDAQPVAASAQAHEMANAFLTATQAALPA